jgi:hypothetical protein
LAKCGTDGGTRSGTRKNKAKDLINEGLPTERHVPPRNGGIINILHTA